MYIIIQIQKLVDNELTYRQIERLSCFEIVFLSHDVSQHVDVVHGVRPFSHVLIRLLISALLRRQLFIKKRGGVRLSVELIDPALLWYRISGLARKSCRSLDPPYDKMFHKLELCAKLGSSLRAQGIFALKHLHEALQMQLNREPVISYKSTLLPGTSDSEREK